MQTAILLLVAYVALDELQQHSEQNGWQKRLGAKWYNTKALQWLNTQTGWQNKHNWGKNKAMKYLYKTALVSLTDGEHFFQLLKHLALAGLVWFFTGKLLFAVAAMLIIALTSWLLNEVILRRG